MKYDYLKEVETVTYPTDNIVRGKKKSKRKINITPFNIAVTQLAVCLAGSFCYLLYLLISNAELFGITEIFTELFENTTI